ncbi:hypothetical protein [Brevibacillus dissolubilis]|uniref:hypothetical protein n=1 Tax=Brevibacillus dissolubilis TaxID=1844116 RepID=UPI00111627FB|nr:hypothetical protein [Brevibacillus dissolubilis]
MARSYKRFPVVKDKANKGKRFAKRLASKEVRRYKLDIPHGSMYRKIFNPWCINDLRFHRTLREVLLDWEQGEIPWMRDKTKQQVINDWKKTFLRK